MEQNNLERIPGNDRPDVFDFNTLQDFLIGFAAWKKESSPSWTLGSWAKSLGLSQTASLSRVLSGQRKAGKSLMDKLVRYFDFDEYRSNFFRYLGVLERANGDVELCELVVSKLKNLHPKGEFQYMDVDLYKALSKWFYSGLIEMTRMKDFNEDAHWIKEQFLFDASLHEIKEALGRLEKIGLLERCSETKRLRPGVYLRDSSRDIENLAAQKNFRENLGLALLAIDKVGLKEREFNNIVFCLKKSDLPKAKEMIREFRQNLCLSLDQASGDEVYIFQTELFPYTKLSTRREL